MQKLPVLIDVDGVLTGGFYEKCCNIINEKYKINYKIPDLVDDLRVVMKEQWDEEMEKIIRAPGFCSDFKPYQGALDWVENIKREGMVDVKYVTSPYKNSPTWGYDRTKWLEKYFGATRDDVILCHDKRYVLGSTLIDDLPKNCVDWSNFQQRRSVLIGQPWNEKFRKTESKASPKVSINYDSPSPIYRRSVY